MFRWVSVGDAGGGCVVAVTGSQGGQRFKSTLIRKLQPIRRGEASARSGMTLMSSRFSIMLAARLCCPLGYF